MKFLRHLLVLAALAAGLSGCATANRTRIVAHADPRFPLAADARIALAERPQAGPQDAELDRTLRDELTRAGYRLATQAEADYTLAFQVEDNVNSQWVTHHTAPTSLTTRYGVVNQSWPYGREGEQNQIVYASQGIRLNLYPSRKAGTGGLTPAWEGYIDAGEQLRADRAPALLRTLLNHLGKDFNGPVSLAP